MPGKPDNVLGSGDVMPSLPGSREKEARGARQRPRGSAITVHVTSSSASSLDENRLSLSELRMITRATSRTAPSLALRPDVSVRFSTACGFSLTKPFPGPSLSYFRDSTVGRTVLGDEFCLVTIRGRVRTITAFGMFFDAHSRFFVPYSMLPRNRRFKRGEPVTLRLALGYARQEGLVG